MIWLFIYKMYWSVDFVKGRVYYYYSICLSIFYLIYGEFACFEDDYWNAWFTSILLPYSSIIIIVLFCVWLFGFELRNTEISHTDLFQHEYLQAEITFRYYLNIVSNYMKDRIYINREERSKLTIELENWIGRLSCCISLNIWFHDLWLFWLDYIS